MNAAVTVAIVSWNTRELLRRCLRSFESEVERGRCEVWVIDNASADGSAEMVRQKFDWVQLIASQENLGFGPAVNVIAARTSTPWIMAANADVEITEGALDALLAAADSATGIVAPRLVMNNGATQHSVHAFPTIRLSILLALGAHRLASVGERLCIETYWDPDRARRIDWAHGALLLVRRTAFNAVGGFDPSQWMYAEDIDLHWRLARSGWGARYEPRARVHHAVSAAAVQAFGEDRLRRHLLATYAWQERRRGRWVAVSCALVNSLGAGVRWLSLAPAALLAPRRYQTTARRIGAYARAHLSALRNRRRLQEETLPPG